MMDEATYNKYGDTTNEHPLLSHLPRETPNYETRVFADLVHTWPGSIPQGLSEAQKYYIATRMASPYNHVPYYGDQRVTSVYANTPAQAYEQEATREYAQPFKHVEQVDRSRANLTIYREPGMHGWEYAREGTREFAQPFKHVEQVDKSRPNLSIYREPGMNGWEYAREGTREFAQPFKHVETETPNMSRLDMIAPQIVATGWADQRKYEKETKFGFNTLYRVPTMANLPPNQVNMTGTYGAAEQGAERMILKSDAAIEMPGLHKSDNFSQLPYNVHHEQPQLAVWGARETPGVMTDISYHVAPPSRRDDVHPDLQDGLRSNLQIYDNMHDRMIPFQPGNYAINHHLRSHAEKAILPHDSNHETNYHATLHHGMRTFSGLVPSMAEPDSYLHDARHQSDDLGWH
jgi:hypothetical protein